MTIKVVVCDRLVIVRDGLRTQLEAEPDINVVATTASGIHALMLVRTERPDVILTGLNLEGLSGLELINRLSHENQDQHPRVVVYAMSDDDTMIDSVLRAGVNGVLVSEVTGTELVAAVRAAAAGQTILAPRITERLVRWFRQNELSADESLGPLLARLTPRERQILLLVARGMCPEEIAEHLTVGVTTARTHLYRVQNKLHLRDRAQLVSFAYRAGLMQSDDTVLSVSSSSARTSRPRATSPERIDVGRNGNRLRVATTAVSGRAPCTASPWRTAPTG